MHFKKTNESNLLIYNNIHKAELEQKNLRKSAESASKTIEPS
jgi:hypothetical protein